MRSYFQGQRVILTVSLGVIRAPPFRMIWPFKFLFVHFNKDVSKVEVEKFNTFNYFILSFKKFLPEGWVGETEVKKIKLEAEKPFLPPSLFYRFLAF